jgi:hypothetical protein
MKKILTYSLFFGAILFFILGVFIKTQKVENTDLGGYVDNFEIDTNTLFETFKISNADSLLKSDLVVIYAVDYSECANSVIEIREYQELVKKRSNQSDISISQAYLLIDKDNNRAQKELKIINLPISSGYGSDSTFVPSLQTYSESAIINKQIIFLKADTIKYRNRISSTVVVPIEEKNKIIEAGIKHAF